MKKLGQFTLKIFTLRRADVIEAAKTYEIDPDIFLSEVDRVEAVPFAIKPVTLNFLINTYRKEGSLPSTQSEIYNKGCLLLCEEPSEERRDARLIANLDPAQRMIIAARIATVTIFANRYAVWTGIDHGDIPDEDISIESLCVGKERISDQELLVSSESIRDALSTGLFSSRGSYRMGFAHQTYAEFLAAHYLINHGMLTTQIMSLIAHPDDPDGKIIPQLYETAAWLAGMSTDVFRTIMDTDPEVLVRSDVSKAGHKDREALVDKLIKLYDEEKLHDRLSDVYRYYKKLLHPRLAEQLQPYIVDKTKNDIVRRVAIEITSACELKMLQEPLLSIALDPQEKIMLRAEAADALSNIADNETRAKLKILVAENIEADIEDELKGHALQALWPGNMTAQELFSAITIPKRDNFVGSYHMFLSSELTKHLQVSDLPVALSWAKSQEADHKLSYAFVEIVNDIMRTAWDHLDAPGILEPFARAAFSRLTRYDNIIGERGDSSFRKSLMREDQKRRSLLETMVQVLQDHERGERVLPYSMTPIALSHDLTWLIQKYQKEESEGKKPIWIRVIQRVFDINDVNHNELIYNVSQVDPSISKSFAWLLKPVRLDTPEAKKMKEDYYELEERKTRSTRRVVLEPPPEKRVKGLLETCESKDPTVWWSLLMELTLEPDSTHYGSDVESDITTFPGWKAADDLTKTRIVRTAETYLIAQDPNAYEWLGKSTFYRPVLAGYKALRLLFKEDSGVISSLSTVLWKKWAPVILAYPTSGEEDGEFQKTILKISYECAKDEIVDTLMVLIDKENSEQGQIYIARKVSDLWDTHITNALLNKLKDQSLKPSCMGSLLGDLLDHEVKEAEDFAKELIRVPIPADGIDRAKAVIAASTLVLHSKDSGWSFLWPIIQQNPNWGREILEEVASTRNEKESIGQRLTEEQLADLFIFLSHNYPHPDDPKHEGGFFGPRTELAWWRDSILTTLKQRGSTRACDALKRIYHELPELKWIKWVIFEAQSITRRKTWIPPDPDHVLKLSSNSESRLVQDGEQLLDVIIDSLRRFALKLQGENFEAQFLWDKDPKKIIYRPKDESAFSDYVKVHLDNDIAKKGIVINREVKIHRVERTDIHVDAITESPSGESFDIITVIIEVKGCWHSELNTAMKTQLVDKYLTDNHCQNGLYLIGWFNCDLWDKGDYRKSNAPTLSIEEAQEQFDAQAESLSKHGLKIRAQVINAAMR